MSPAAVISLRSRARHLPVFERKRRLEKARKAAPIELLRAVMTDGLNDGEWESASDFAERVLVCTPRRLRRWLSGAESDIPWTARKKLVNLAWAFGTDVVDPA